MQIKPFELAGMLQKTLAPVYLLSGDEPQQLAECADLIRQTAKAQAFSTREIFIADKQFDWNQLTFSADNFSLFSDKKVLDLRLTSGLPGTQGAKVITTYCQRLPEDTLLLITTGKIAKESFKSAWLQGIDKVGCIIQVWPLAGQDLLNWIDRRMRLRGLLPDADVVNMLAERVEGNLLAAAQEIEKLFVLFGVGKVQPQQIIDTVSDHSRYDVFKLVESALLGKGVRILKILSSLKNEGVAPTLTLWAILRETRILIGYKAANAQSEKETLLKINGIWGSRKQMIDQSAKNHSFTQLNAVLALGAKADRQIKGQQTGDVWETLLQASLVLANSAVV